MTSINLNYTTPRVPDGWAESRETHPAIAMAIWAVADESRSPEAIWDDPTPQEVDHITMAVQQYVETGLFPPEPDCVYPWGHDAIVLTTEEEAA